MNYTPAQYDAITSDGNIVVTAGAGSGKTRVLVERYLRLLTTSNTGNADVSDTLPSADALLAITFTDKAAREMRDRVRTTLEARARAATRDERVFWEERRAAIESSRIGTIHSFCASILRNHPAETGLDPRFATLDEVETTMLITESIETTLGQALSTPLALFHEFSPHELQMILEDMIRAGATVQKAIESLPATADDLVSRAAAQVPILQRTVIEELCNNVAWQTACTTLRRLAPIAPANDRAGSQVCALADWLVSFYPLTSDSLTTLPDFTPVATIDLRGGSKKAWPDDETLAQAKDTLKKLRDIYKTFAPLLNLLPDDDLEQRAAQAVQDLVKLYYAARTSYSQRKSQRGALDFDDLIHQTRHLLEDNPAVRARWQAEIDTVLVDEFQDTDDDQRALVYALTGFGANAPAPVSLPVGWQPARLPSLFVVGDGKQSIYRFRGADVSVFRRVEDDICTRGGKRICLATSFRTNATLVAWINRVSHELFSRNRSLQPYEVPFEALDAHRPPPEHTRCVEMHILATDTASESDEGQSELLDQPVSAAGTAQATVQIGEKRSREAQLIAQRILALVAGEAGACIYDQQQQCWRLPVYGDIALLFRASTVFEYYEQAFREHGIPYLTTAGSGYYGRQEVQDLIHLVRVLHDPLDDLALVGVLRSPLFALDDGTIMRLRFANSSSLWSALMVRDDEKHHPDDVAQATPDSGTDVRAHTDTKTQQPGDETDSFLSDVPLYGITPPETLTFARETLRSLYAMRGQVTVVELLRAILAKTGYLATISGLQHGDRRRANVEKLLEAARRSVHAGLSDFSLYLEHLLRAGPREGEAPLEAEGSVRLMTIHASKGLEFPMVVLPDLGRRSHSRQDLWMAHPQYGVALRLRSATGEWQKPLAYNLATYEEQRMEQAERERLLYVALTRAKDYLILSGPAAKRDDDSWLSSLLRVHGWSWADGGPPEGTHDEMDVWWHTDFP